LSPAIALDESEMLYHEIDTPAVMIDLEKMEQNIHHMAERARQFRVKLRPHVKTHKSPWIAHLQLTYGACGITVAKLGEAEVMVDAGIHDILVAYPIWGEEKLSRLSRLLDRAKVSLSLDSLEVAEGLSNLGKRKGIRIPIYLEIDTGMGRCGLKPGEGARSLAQKLTEMDGLELIGLLTHAGHGYNAKSEEELRKIGLEEGGLLVELATILRKEDGIEIREISVGSTPTARFVVEVPGITELRTGTYVFNDVGQIRAGSASLENCAASVLVTVVGRPASHRAIIDGGSKTFTSDRRVGMEEYGIIKGRSGLSFVRMSEEHGIIIMNEKAEDLKIGERLEIIPNHICSCINLCDEIYGVRDGKLERVISIAARGKSR
jgi:D-serine deaminase-like pyridoxal phosphate-dependent protein